MKAKLLELSVKITKPTKPFINLQAIYDVIQDLPAKHIREEVQDVCKQGFSFKTDSTQWHKPTLNKHTTKSALDEPHKIDKHFFFLLKSYKVHIFFVTTNFKHAYTYHSLLKKKETNIVLLMIIVPQSMDSPSIQSHPNMSRPLNYPRPPI